MSERISVDCKRISDMLKKHAEELKKSDKKWNITRLMDDLDEKHIISLTTLKTIKSKKKVFERMDAATFKKMCDGLGLAESERQKLIYQWEPLLVKKQKVLLKFIKSMPAEELESFWKSVYIDNIRGYIECEIECINKDAIVEYWEEDDGTYTVRLPLPLELCELFGMEPILDDIHIYASAQKGSKEWIEEMRSCILRRAEDVDDASAEIDLYEKFLQTITDSIYEWKFIENKDMEDDSDQKDLFGEEQTVFYTLILKLAIDDRYEDIKQVKRDYNYAEDLIKKYHLR